MQIAGKVFLLTGAGSGMGREMAHQHLGMDLLKRVQDDVAEVAKVEAFPRLEGRQMLMVLAPK